MKPELFETKGTKGWRVRIPGGRAVPTPAVAHGRVLVGGGFGSHEFYAFDAATGELAWQLRTKDDGPTAAVVSDGHAVFNTESCTLMVVDAAEGRLVAESWLGDPLLAQPAVADGRVFMVFPGQGGHWLGSFELPGLKPLWRTALSHDVITAPVCAAGKVWLATHDGAVWCVDQISGAVEWTRPMQATSAPWIYEGEVYVAHRVEPSARAQAPEAGAGGATERTVRYTAHGKPAYAWDAKRAPYLEETWGKERKHLSHAADAAVGFSQAPAAAKLDVSAALLGERTVSRAWRYQGSRPVVVEGLLLDSAGDQVEARDLSTGALVWAWNEREGVEGERRLTPPAAANGRVWAGSWDGWIRSWDARSGLPRWQVAVGSPVHWQPAIADGWVYAGLEDGCLVGFETGDPLDDGWPMWGGGSGHNGGHVATRSKTGAGRTGRRRLRATGSRRSRGVYEFRIHNGHLLFFDVDGATVLLDTGAPASIGRESVWKFQGRDWPLARAFGGVSLDYLGEYVGVPIHVLLGADILSRYHLRIEGNPATVTFTESPPRWGAPLHLQLPMGIPVAEVSIGGRWARVFLDTGAKLSYLTPPVLRQFPETGEASDFYPGIGRFTTRVWRAEMLIGGEDVTLDCGSLPRQLEPLLRMGRAEGIVGTELLKTHDLCLSYPASALRLRRRQG